MKTQSALAIPLVVSAFVAVAAPSSRAHAAAPECADLTVGAMGDLQDQISAALFAVPAGTQPQYVAARNALTEAQDEIEDAIAFMEDNDPATTHYAEAAQLAAWLSRANVDLWNGALQASVGAAVHGSSQARSAFKLTMEASETTTDLRRKAGLCYMGGYLP
ncbi:MAG: hypothetical protein ACE37F_14695 [Nannocystaceae bacterium]|nr:hypothetical protein [bacterium]